jgi:hypothetical protein
MTRRPELASPGSSFTGGIPRPLGPKPGAAGHHRPGRVAGRPGPGAALAIALTAIRSVETGGPVRLGAVEQR